MPLVRSAVLPVAGLGTRFLPVTKAIPKELLPIVNKPLIQYAVDEACNAGIEKLIIVTGPHKQAIRDYFARNTELEKALHALGKENEAALVRNVLPKSIECVFVQQDQQLGLGHAVLCAEKEIDNEPFAVLLADELLLENKENTTKKLIDEFNSSGCSQLSVIPVEESQISKYGIIDPGPTRNSIKGIMEKPANHLAPSNLASIGRYILKAEIFDILRDLKKGKGQEFQLSDAINNQAQIEIVQYVKYKGKRFDCGTTSGFVNAIKFMSK